MESILGKLINYLIEIGMFEIAPHNHFARGYTVEVDGTKGQLMIFTSYADDGTPGHFPFYQYLVGGSHKYYVDHGEVMDDIVMSILTVYMLDKFLIPKSKEKTVEVVVGGFGRSPYMEYLHPNDLGRGLTEEASMRLMVEQNPHLYQESPKIYPEGYRHSVLRHEVNPEEYYIPSPDEPSPFAPLHTLPEHVEWNIWRRAKATGLFCWESAETYRQALILNLETTAISSIKDIVGRVETVDYDAKYIPTSRGTKYPTLASVIAYKHRYGVSWVAAHSACRRMAKPDWTGAPDLKAVSPTLHQSPSQWPSHFDIDPNEVSPFGLPFDTETFNHHKDRVAYIKEKQYFQADLPRIPFNLTTVDGHLSLGWVIHMRINTGKDWEELHTIGVERIKALHKQGIKDDN